MQPRCQRADATAAAKVPLRSLVNSRSVVGAYVGSGLQLFVGGTVIVWIPSYLNRYYAMATDVAGGVSAMIVLVSGMGMIACGMLSDRLCRNAPEHKFSLAIAYCLASCALLSLAFALPHGTPQLVMIAWACCWPPAPAAPPAPWSPTSRRCRSMAPRSRR